MDNRQARKTGRTIMVCGCFLIILTKVLFGAIMIAVGLLFSIVLGRCPHCGRLLLGLPSSATSCPKCHRPL